MKRRLPTEEHENGWQKFETEVLEVRAIAFIGIQLIVTSIGIMFRSDYYNYSGEYQDGAVLQEIELSEKFINFAKILNIALQVLRFVVFMLSLKYRPCTRVIFYVQILIQLSQACMPIDVAATQFYIKA